MQHIFDALLTDGIPSSAVRCLQRLSNGTLDITFGTQEMRDQFLRKSAFIVNRRPYAAHPAQRHLTFVTILDAPYELTERALQYRLQKHGRVYSQRRGKIQSHPSLCNGRRHIRMDIHKEIPSFLRFGKFLLRVSYEGQPKTWSRCDSRDHLAKDCRNTFCFNCDSIGHVSKQCPSNVKCCICKEESHKAIDCQLSWFWGLPSHRSPDPEPAAVSVENLSSDDNETVTSDNDLSSVMDVQRQEDGHVPASISDVHDDDDDADDHDDYGGDDDDAGDDADDDADADNANDDAAADDDNGMDDGDSCDEIVACLHADYDESEEDTILGPRKRPREDDNSPDLFSKSPRPQDSGSLQSLQKSQIPPVSPSEAPT